MAEVACDDRPLVFEDLVRWMAEGAKPASEWRVGAEHEKFVFRMGSHEPVPYEPGGIKALLDGLDDMPPADPAVRAVLADEASEKGWPALHAELAQVDPVTAARLAPNDSQRISRALEVFRVSGQPLSFFHQRKAAKAGAGEAGAGEADAPTAIPLISLEPHDRAWLHGRIAQRFDAMLAAGFIDEVMSLRARGDLVPDLPSMRCVGYRQVWEALDAMETSNAEHGQESNFSPKAWSELRDKGIFATRQLAKRQITWLRSMPQRQIVACDAPDALEQVLARVKAHVESSAKAVT